jgi:hypothetical protein
LAIGLTTFAVLVITLATRITFGGQAIGHGATTSEFGSTVITSCDDTDRARWVPPAAVLAHRIKRSA